jgi:hypothetical protein
VRVGPGRIGRRTAELGNAEELKLHDGTWKGVAIEGKQRSANVKSVARIWHSQRLIKNGERARLGRVARLTGAKEMAL